MTGGREEVNQNVQMITVEAVVEDDAIVISYPHDEEGTVTMRLHTDGYMSVAYETPNRYYVIFYEKY